MGTCTSWSVVAAVTRLLGPKVPDPGRFLLRGLGSRVYRVEGLGFGV